MYIKRMYIRSYVQRHRDWPPCILDPLGPEGFQEAQRRKCDPEGMAVQNAGYTVTIQDYVYVDLLPNLELDGIEHYTQFLTDKTIALCQSSVLESYIHQELGRHQVTPSLHVSYGRRTWIREIS